MDAESALVAPPPALLLPLGEPMPAVAQALRSRLPAVTIVSVGSATIPVASGPPAAQAAGPGLGQALVVVVLVGAQTTLSDLSAAFAWLSTANLPRRRRTWIAADPRCPRALLVQLDALLDAPGAPRVDSVVVLPDADPVAVAVALQAWLWLRHDAPSGAFADLRDDGQSCRFAAVAAVAPAASPSDPVPTSLTRTGEHALLVLRTEMDQRASAAHDLAHQHALGVLTDPNTALVGADLTPPIPEVPRSDVDDIVAAIDPADLAGVRAATQACNAVVAQATESAATTDPLTAATMALVQADTAVRVETSRNGLAARLGRRKRLAAATAARAAAASEWARVYADVAADLLRVAIARDLASVLPVIAQGHEQRRREQAAANRRRAHSSWLSDVAQAASRATPSVELAPSGLFRGWGRAAPSIRRYALIPAESAAVAGAAEADGPHDVQVRTADGLSSPIAAALVMGMPLSGLRLLSDPGAEGSSAPAE